MSVPPPRSRPLRPASAPSPSSDPARSARSTRAYELDRAHVFHSWSAQAALNPLVVAGGQGSWVWDGDGTPVPGLLQPARLHQHRVRPPEGRRGDPGAGRHARHDRPAARQRRSLRGRPADRRAGSRRRTSATSSSPTAAPTRSRTPSGWPACTPDAARCSARYRSYHGNTTTAINLTGDPRRWPNDYGAEGVVHFFGPFLYRSVFHATTERGGVQPGAGAPGAADPARGAGHDRRDRAGVDPRHRGDHGAAAGLPARGPGALRPVRHRLDRRRGDERVRPGRALVRRELADLDADGRRCPARPVEPDLVTFAKGVNSGYVPLGGVIVSRPIYETFADTGVPRRADLLRAPAGLRGGGRHDHRDGRRGRGRRTPHRLGREVFGPGLAELAARHEIIGEVRGHGCLLGAGAGPGPGDPAAAGAVQRHRRGERPDRRAGRPPAAGAACCPSSTAVAPTSSRR